MAERTFIETEAADDCRLRVEFIRRSDRYGHLIQLVHGGEVSDVLGSVEGEPVESWPASPVLQHVHLESRPRSASAGPVAVPADAAAKKATEGESSRTVALLVGLGGRSHWSMSVEPLPAGQGLEFDVACRVPVGVAPQLQTTYHAGGVANGGGEAATRLEAVPVGEPESSYRIRLDAQRHVIVRAIAPTRLQVDGLEAGLIRLIPAASETPTWRWKYVVELHRVGTTRG